MTFQFQIETLASLVRYYKKKCQQQRTLLDRARLESQHYKALRKFVVYVALSSLDLCLCRKYEDLKVHNQQMKDYINRDRSRGLGPDPSESVNSNSKRPMLDSHRYFSHLLFIHCVLTPAY